MDVINGLMQGFVVALTPATLMWCFAGCFLGTIIGILPGLGPAATIAMLLPLTFKNARYQCGDHAGRDLLRCEIRRINYGYPAQCAR